MITTNAIAQKSVATPRIHRRDIFASAAVIQPTFSVSSSNGFDYKFHSMNAVIVIPARFESTRFPGKPLAMIAGRSLVQRVYERAIHSSRSMTAYVATDDRRIFEHVESFGGHVVMTSVEHGSGTDRIAEALSAIETEEERTFARVINLQGDEPLIDIGEVDRMIEVLEQERVDIVTLATPFLSDEEFRSRDVVKVVTDLKGNALYFSRSPIPHDDSSKSARHVGVYGYQVEALRRFTALSPSPLELCESLEQLRALQNGFRIRVLATPKSHLGVDRPEDIEKVERELAKTNR